MQANLPTWHGVNQREDGATRTRSGGPADLHACRSALTCTRAVSKTDGSQSLDLQRDALETVGVDAVNVSTTSRPVSRRSRTSTATPPCTGSSTARSS